MPWQLSIVLHSFLSAFRSIQNRRIGNYRRDLSLYALLVSFVCVSLTGAALAITDANPINHSEAWSARYYLLAGGMALAFVNYLTIKLFRMLPASIVVIMSLLNPLALVLAASLLLDETMSAYQWIGTIFLLSAVLLTQLFTVKKRKKHATVSLGLVVAIVIAGLYGLGIVNEKYLLDRLELPTYLFYGWGMQFISVLVVCFLLRKKFHMANKIKEHVDVWSYGFLLATSGFLFVISQVNSDSASLTAVSSSAKVVLTVVLAYILLKERSYLLLKIASLCLSVIGLFFLFI